MDELGIGEDIIRELDDKGRRTIKVIYGDSYEKINENAYVLGSSQECYNALLTTLFS